jgi:uncharacterized protein (DUF58 family)
VLTGLGWSCVAVGLVAVAIGHHEGWTELAAVGVLCLALVALACMFLFGRTLVRVDLEVAPMRTTVGSPSSGAVHLMNTTRTPLLPILLELPVGPAVARFRLPVLMPEQPHEELFVVPADRRGVYPVGPAMTRRGDPLGLVSRDLTWGGEMEVFVRPRMVPLDSLGGGLLRDLEGVSTDAISMSDLAFHALREYSPGDDLRHVHWRSSAKAGQLLVRQYVDTRRSHATVVVDQDPDAYADPDDFETAVSVAASVAVRAALDDFEISLVCGEHAGDGDANHVLDMSCRLGTGPRPLAETARAAAALAPDTSLLLMLSGSRAEFGSLQRAASAFPVDVRRLLIQIDPRRPTRVSEVDGYQALSLNRLDDLAGLLQWSAR